MPSFRLDKEPWIPVICADGSEQEVSLVDVFKYAGEYRGLGGTPAEVPSILRFLLAIAHLVQTPTSLTSWAQLWQDRQEFVNRCAKYVDQLGDVWDIFDERNPFGQVRGLGGTRNPAHLLTYESARMNNPLLADHSNGKAPQQLEAARVFRGVLATQAFTGSSKAGSSGVLVVRSVAMLKGETLAEDLILNLLVGKEALSLDWRDYGNLRTRNTPPSIVERYLWTSRQMELVGRPDSTDCSEVVMAPGNKIEDEDKANDPMIVFRKSSDGKDYVPLRLEAGRALWRSADVLLACAEGSRRLPAIDQLLRIVSRGLVSEQQHASLRVCAIGGDAQGPTTTIWRDEQLHFGLSVLRSQERFSILETSLSAATEQASKIRKRLYVFAYSYLQDGAEGTPDKNEVARLADELSPGLSDFWSAAGPMGERIALDDFDEPAWSELLTKAANDTYRQAVDRLPADARRFRAEYATSESRSKSSRKGGKQK